MADTDAASALPGPAGAVPWWAMGFGNRDGDVVQAWSCPLPADFADRLEKDQDGLRQEVAEQAAAGGGRLIEADRVMVDGRPAFRRIVRLPADVFPTAVYVAGLVVPLDGDIGVEITVTCGALGDLLGGRAHDARGREAAGAGTYRWSGRWALHDANDRNELSDDSTRPG